ncbi:MAG: hypothetical protein KC421_30465, partial [Anaerolineales bacterium]|nr:hypothetical protein [Anaerolineales bacterium]
VTKTYLALVHGIPDPAADTIALPIGKVNAPGKGDHFGIDEDGGKTAVTNYQTVETFTIHRKEREKKSVKSVKSVVSNEQTNTFSLVQLTPKTGRTHQLRVHLAAIGHPIVADKRYGIDDEAVRTENGRLLLTRQALHCAATQFQHPQTGSDCTITAPLPADLQALLQYGQQRSRLFITS